MKALEFKEFVEKVAGSLGSEEGFTSVIPMSRLEEYWYLGWLR